MDQIDALRCIQQELDRVAALDSDKLVADSGHGDDREWWVLGRTAKCLAAAGERFPPLAQKLPPPGPDFRVWWEQSVPAFHLEVTEVLAPNRKRTKEYRQRRKSSPDAGFSVIGEASLSQSEAGRIVAERIGSKLAKVYPRETVLLLYHNMWRFDFTEPGQWPHDLMATARGNGPLALTLDRVKESPIARILVLNSGGDGLMSLFPTIQDVWSTVVSRGASRDPGEHDDEGR